MVKTALVTDCKEVLVKH